MPIENTLTHRLKLLAEKYETADFIKGDPSWFMHQIDGDTNKELLAFIASSLSYGSRKQFMPKIQLLLDNICEFTSRKKVCNNEIVSSWLISREFEKIIPQANDSFYRLYTYTTYNKFLYALALLAEQYGSIKKFLLAEHNVRQGEKICAIDAIESITRWFREHDSKGVIPQNTRSSCKRVCMFLRWMVRSNSPVDIGIWSDIIDHRTLIIPMDTHVVQEAMRMKLITSSSTSMANAIRLSRRLAEVFPNDPIRGDFALFGLGADDSKTH